MPFEISDAPQSSFVISDPPAPSWSDIPGQALSNLPSSAMGFLKGVGQTVMHPIQTAGTLMDAAAGGLRNITPTPIANVLDSIGSDPATNERITNTANKVGGVYANRYGSIDALKNTLATDPVGAAADLSTILGAGSGLAKLGGLDSTAGALRVASAATNPATPILMAAQGAGKVAGVLGKNALGLTTGVGPENVGAAAKAGYAGDSSFLSNLTGKAPITDALDQAQNNLQLMKQQNSAAYRSGMVDISKDKSILDFSNVNDALDKASSMGMYKGQIKNPQAASAVQKVNDLISSWKNLAPTEFHTPEGLDALKQQIGGVLESIPYEQKTARAAVGGIYSAIKNTIQEQAPTYANVMKNYAEGSDLINEIQRTLSQNPRATVDTALRKLQSLSRNNVNTNYGYRTQLGNTLANVPGGTDFMPALSGQAMNSWTSRSMPAQGGELATLGAALLHPGALAMLPFTSPKFVGALAYGAGKGATLLPKYTADQARIAALVASQAGQQ